MAALVGLVGYYFVKCAPIVFIVLMLSGMGVALLAMIDIRPPRNRDTWRKCLPVRTSSANN